MKHRITAFGVACAFLVCCVLMVGVLATFSGCATIKDYYTIDMYIIGTPTPIPTHLPNEVKQFKLEEANGWLVFNSPQAGVIRYGVEGIEFFCDHWIKPYTGKDIMLIIWDKHGIFVKGWIYNDKGIPVKAYEETVMDLLYDLIGQPEKGDSV